MPAAAEGLRDVPQEPARRSDVGRVELIEEQEAQLGNPPTMAGRRNTFLSRGGDNTRAYGSHASRSGRRRRPDPVVRGAELSSDAGTAG